MGGSGSGRQAQRSRTTTTDMWRLNVRALIVSARGQALEGDAPGDMLAWGWRHAERPPSQAAASTLALFERPGNNVSTPPPETLLVWARADLAAQTLELAYEARGAEMRQELAFEAEPCHFGGSRLWARCACDRRAAVMYGPPFACVRCHELLYPTERMSEADRMLSRARKLRLREAGGEGLEFMQLLTFGAPIPLPNKPRRAWHSRFDRVEEQCQRFEQRAVALHSARWARFGRSG